MISESQDAASLETSSKAGPYNACAGVATGFVALADRLLKIEPAAVLGKMGRKATAKRGSEYFRQIAAMQKARAGGRPA